MVKLEGSTPVELHALLSTQFVAWTKRMKNEETERKPRSFVYMLRE